MSELTEDASTAIKPGGVNNDDTVLRLFRAAHRGRLDPDVELAALLSKPTVSAVDISVALLRPAAQASAITTSEFGRAGGPAPTSGREPV